MASTATTSNRIQKMGDGEKTNTWGTEQNTNHDLLDESLDGFESIAVVGGTNVLTNSNYASDQARNRMLKITGTLASNEIIQIPAVSKWYIIWDATTRAGFTLTVKTSGGVAATISSTGAKVIVFCDGTDCYVSSPELLNVALDCNDKVVSKGEAKDWSATVNALGNTTGTVSTGGINYESGHIVTATFTGNVTLANDSFGNWPTSGKFGVIRMKITQDGTGSRTLTLGSAYNVPGGSLTLSTGAAAYDWLEFSTLNGGTTIDVNIVKNYS